MALEAEDGVHRLRQTLVLAAGPRVTAGKAQKGHKLRWSCWWPAKAGIFCAGSAPSGTSRLNSQFPDRRVVGDRGALEQPA